MIKLINSAEEINEYSKIDLFSVRIKSILKAYGTSYGFASFYCQYDGDNNITSIMSKLDGDITISYNNNCDLCETAQFIKAIGFNTVLSDERFNFDTGFTSGIIMSTNKKPDIFPIYAELDEYPKLMDLFNFTDYETSDFELWYADVSHRIRHNCAKAYTLCINDEIISSGMFSAMYDDCAVLSAVKTQQEFRGLGYGSALVSAMMNDIKSTVFLMRDNDKNESFYKRLGFENTGIWRIYK